MDGAVGAAIEAADVDVAIAVAIAIVGRCVVDGVGIAVLVEAFVVAHLLRAAVHATVGVVAVEASATRATFAVAVTVPTVFAGVLHAAALGLLTHLRGGAW
jgi:hypothetical protein